MCFSLYIVLLWGFPLCLCSYEFIQKLFVNLDGLTDSVAGLTLCFIILSLCEATVITLRVYPGLVPYVVWNSDQNMWLWMDGCLKLTYRSFIPIINP